jgi:hypothetical protein
VDPGVHQPVRRPPLGFDVAVYESESRTGHGNRAIGHLLRNFDVLTDDPMADVEVYFRQCAISVTCRDLAVKRQGFLDAHAAAMLAWENSGFSIDASVRITLLDRDVLSYFRRSSISCGTVPGPLSHSSGSP